MTIHVIMAVFKPVPHHLTEQLASLAAQSGVTFRLHVVIADLTSMPVVADCAAETGLAPEIHVPPKKLNAVAAFEFGLAEALRSAAPQDVFSLCDQDDVWHPDKLSRSVAAMQARAGCHLVHTDARLVDDAGAQIAGSMFAHENRARETGLRRLLYRNSITGMTAVFSREVVAHALPFPKQGGVFFYHDLWLGLVAAAKGPIVSLRTATVDYRQHGQNAVGAVSGGDGLKLLSRPWLRQRFASFSLACYLAKSLILRVDQISISEPAAFDRTRLRRLRPYLRPYGIGIRFFVDSALYRLRDTANWPITASAREL